MSVVTLAGWFVTHALWQDLFIAGAAAWTLSRLRHTPAAVRDRVGRAGLALMLIAPIVTTLRSVDVFSEWARRPILMSIDRAIPLPIYFKWRSTLIPVAGALWISGFLIAAVRLTIAWRWTRTLRSERSPDAGADAAGTVAELRGELAIAAAVTIRTSSRARVPMVLGWRRPVILLPQDTFAALRPDQRRAIIAHELAHVRRGDYAANLLQRAADGLLFFHPAARWLSAHVRKEREYCCDDIAIAVTGDASMYARALASLEEARGGCELAVAAASGTLRDRIARIAGRGHDRLTPRRGTLALMTAAGAAIVIAAMALALPQSTPAGTQLRRRVPPGANISAPAMAPGQLKRRSADTTRAR